MDSENYRAKQAAVYAEFRAATASLDELDIDPAIIRPCAGYIVALRHDGSIMEPFAQFTASLRHFVPSLHYHAGNGHTTLTVYEKQSLATFQPDPTTLDNLSRIVAQIHQAVWQQVRIDFRDWYFNRETIIVAGEPNDAFWQVGERVQEVGAQHGLSLRMPWGAHMTAGRFIQPCDANTVAVLRQRVQTAPNLGVSAPTSIYVGYFTTSEAGFVLHDSSQLSARPYI